MEKAILTGWQYYSVTGEDGRKNEGYSMFLLEPIRGEENKGYKPIQVYNRYQNRPKYPTMSRENFIKFGVKDFSLNKPVEFLIDRGNHLVEMKQ